MKTEITKNLIMKPYQTDIKFLRYFQTGGVAISFGLFAMFIVKLVGNQEAQWEYLGVGLFVFVLLIILPLRVSRNDRNRIQEIKNDRFTIIKDVVMNKDAKAKKDKQSGDYKWEYVIGGVHSGNLPKLNKNDWDSCEVGDEIYVIIDAENKPMMSFPTNSYKLSSEVCEVFVNI